MVIDRKIFLDSKHIPKHLPDTPQSQRLLQRGRSTHVFSCETGQNQVIHFALYLNNKGYKASLEVGKLYRMIANKQATAQGLIRSVDESGEGYAFAANRFDPVPLPQNIEEALLMAS